MENKMNVKNQGILSFSSLYLLSQWPFAHYILHNYQYFTPEQIFKHLYIGQFSFLIALVFVCWGFLLSGKKLNIIQVCLIVTVLYPLLFLREMATDLGTVLFQADHPAVAPAVLTHLLILFAVGFISYWFVKLRKAPEIIFLFALTVFAMQGLNAGIRGMQSKKNTNIKAVEYVFPDMPDRPVRAPDIYVVIMDGYPRNDVLRATFQFDNSDISQKLSDRGFDILDNSYSNYTKTVLAVSSMLSMNYTVTPERDDGNFENLYIYSSMIKGNNNTVQTLKDYGYQYLHAGAGVYTGSNCDGMEDICLTDREGMEGKEIPYSFDEAAAKFIAMTPLYYYFFLKDVPIIKGTDLKALTESLEAYAFKLRSPRFFFAHTLPPHPPYIYTAECEERQDKVFLAHDAVPGYRQEYVENIQCTNKMIIEFVDKVLSISPDPVIILTGDHGSMTMSDWSKDIEDWTEEQIRERFGIFTAMRLPKSCRQWIREDLSIVNYMRLVMGCLAGKEPEYLPYRSFYASYNVSAETYFNVKEFNFAF